MPASQRCASLERPMPQKSRLDEWLPADRESAGRSSSLGRCWTVSPGGSLRLVCLLFLSGARGQSWALHGWTKGGLCASSKFRGKLAYRVVCDCLIVHETLVSMVLLSLLADLPASSSSWRASARAVRCNPSVAPAPSRSSPCAASQSQPCCSP